MNSSPLAAIWHWYPLLAWVACARFCSLPLGSLSYLNFYRKLRLDSNFSYGTGLISTILDRAWEALIKLALEPVAEAEFHSKSYGFRPGRSAWDAAEDIFNQTRSIAT